MGSVRSRHDDEIVNEKLCVVHIAQFILPYCSIII